MNRMLILNNIEGDKYNPFIDQYLVLQVNDYANTQFNEIDQLLKMIEQSHEELIMIETQIHGLDLIQFLENIDKIVIHKQVKACDTYHLTVQKNLLNFH
jgi:hypothetical protein